MQAGHLRHLITLDSPPGTRDSFGQPTQDWTPFATARAEVQPLNGRDYFAAAAEEIEVTTRIRIRWMPDVTAAMRVRFEDKVYNIVSVIDPDERHRELVLMCNEGQRG